MHQYRTRSCMKSMAAPCHAILITTFMFVSAFSASNAKPLTNSQPFKKIYAFGDSFTDTGNTRSVSGPNGFSHVSNFPYGMTFFHHPTNRYSDGRLVIDFVAEQLSLPYLPAYLNLKKNATSSHGVNFAVGGSTAINHAFFAKNNLSLDVTPESIQTQTIWFNKYLERQGCKGSATSSPECEAAFDDALFWVGEIGVNDYAYITGSTITTDTIRKLAISSVTGFLQVLLEKGAKYIVVQGLPPAGCLTLPMSLTGDDDRDELGCTKSINNQSSSHNTDYLAKLGEFRTQFPQATIVYLDYWSAYVTVLKNPQKYGIKETFKACCGSGDPIYNFNVFVTCGMSSVSACKNPAEYINWDGVHLTEGMYKVLTNMFINETFSHPPFMYMLARKERGG